MNIIFIVQLMPINKTSWLTTCNPYSDNFCRCCVITPMVVGSWRPTFGLSFLSSTWFIDKVFCLQLHYKSCLFPHSLEWLLVLRTCIMCNASLSISTMSLTRFWVFDDPHSELVALRNNHLSCSVFQTSHILHLTEGPLHLIAQSPIF